jgi:hypothetical protein
MEVGRVTDVSGVYASSVFGVEVGYWIWRKHVSPKRRQCHPLPHSAYQTVGSLSTTNYSESLNSVKLSERKEGWRNLMISLYSGELKVKCAVARDILRTISVFTLRLTNTKESYVEMARCSVFWMWPLLSCLAVETAAFGSSCYDLAVPQGRPTAQHWGPTLYLTYPKSYDKNIFFPIYRYKYLDCNDQIYEAQK